MKKFLGTAMVALGLAAVPAVASAQMGTTRNTGNQPTEGMMFGVGAGLTMPMGDYSTIDGMGFHALGMVQMPIHNTPIHLRADVMFSTTSHKSGFTSGSSRLIGGTVDGVYHIGERSASLRPYVLGGIGLFNAHESVTGASNTNFAFGLGGGILFGLGTSMHGFAEARYMSVATSGGSTSFVPISVGLMFSGK